MNKLIVTKTKTNTNSDFELNRIERSSPQIPLGAPEPGETITGKELQLFTYELGNVLQECGNVIYEHGNVLYKCHNLYVRLLRYILGVDSF